MTTEALRKVIKVTYWILSEKGLSISYDREDAIPQRLHLILTPLETIKELSIVGSIGESNAQDLMAMVQINPYNFGDISSVYKMCQWEALSIAIRHEEEKELANDMNMLELDAAINALK